MATTTLQVLRELGKATQSESCLGCIGWTDGSADYKLLIPTDTRSEHQRNSLAGFNDYLHMDDYAGFHNVKGFTFASR